MEPNTKTKSDLKYPTKTSHPSVGVSHNEDELINAAARDSDEDEAVLKLQKIDPNNDKILNELENSGLIEQNDYNVVQYSVENLYSDKKMKKFRNKIEMKSNPPELKIESNDGSAVSFFLTKQLTNKLLLVLTDVQKAYVGIKKTEQHTDKIPASKRGFGKISALLKLHSHEVIIALFFAMAGLLYSSNFGIGSIIAFVIGCGIIFVPHKNKKEDQ